jgi:hypothetical protein
MNVIRHTMISAEALLERLKQTRLVGHGRPYIYQHATLELVEQADPEQLAPAQRYVLKGDFQRIEALYQTFLARSVDIFRLRGGLLFWTQKAPGQQPAGPFPLLPPLVEESQEPGNQKVLLINDGMHRVYAARRLHKGINVILAKGVPPQYPYYAYALPEGWQGVETLSELPAGYRKKTYREPRDHKALFRDFNEVLPGVQRRRSHPDPGAVQGS